MVSLNEQWLKHAPWVEISEDKLIIKVGHKIDHPMQEVHLIETIVLLSYTKAWLLKVKEIKLSANDKPETEIPLADLKPWTYKVQAKCNLHGTWDEDFVI